MASKREFRKTSNDAYESIKEKRVSQYAKIIEALRILKVGATYEQVSYACDLDKIQVARRLDEMVKKGLVYNVGNKRKTSSGCDAMVRQLVELKNEVQETSVSMGNSSTENTQPKIF